MGQNRRHKKAFGTTRPQTSKNHQHDEQHRIISESAQAGSRCTHAPIAMENRARQAFCVDGDSSYHTWRTSGCGCGASTSETKEKNKKQRNGTRGAIEKQRKQTARAEHPAQQHEARHPSHLLVCQVRRLCDANNRRQTTSPNDLTRRCVKVCDTSHATPRHVGLPTAAINDTLPHNQHITHLPEPSWRPLRRHRS